MSTSSLEKLCEIVSGDIERLFLALDLKVRKGFRSYSGSCFVHGGNQHCLSIYERDGVYYWKCHSSSCEKLFNHSLIGLTQACLSCQKEGWSENGDKKYSFGRTVKYLKELYNITNSDLTVTNEWLDKKKFVKETELFNACGYTNLCSRDKYLSMVTIPSQYFIKRGFSEKILTEYDVGEYNSKDYRAKLRGRAVIPVYDDNGENIIGVSGRSINGMEPKWLHSKQFPSCYSLFNYWKAKEYIKKKKEVVLVEGPLDCIRLVEAGIKNVCGLMGNYLSVSKQIKMDLLGVNSLILMLDNDQGGIEGTKRIISECSHFYNIKQINLPEGKDPADLNVDEIRSIFK